MEKDTKSPETFQRKTPPNILRGKTKNSLGNLRMEHARIERAKEMMCKHHPFIEILRRMKYVYVKTRKCPCPDGESFGKCS